MGLWGRRSSDNQAYPKKNKATTDPRAGAQHGQTFNSIKKVSSPIELTDVKQTKPGEKPYFCRFCGKSFEHYYQEVEHEDGGKCPKEKDRKQAMKRYRENTRVDEPSILKSGKVDKSEKINEHFEVKREYHIIKAKDTGPNNTLETNMLLGYNMKPRKISLSADNKTLMELVQSDHGWKYPTKPIKVVTLQEAQRMADALSFYLGGAEIFDTEKDGYVVTSRGYYHYIGA